MRIPFRTTFLLTAIIGIAEPSAWGITVVNGDFNTQTAGSFNGEGSNPFDGELGERGYAQFTDYNGDAMVLQEDGQFPNDGADGAIAPGTRLINIPGWAADQSPAGVADYLPLEVDLNNVHDDFAWVSLNGYLFQNIGNSVAGATYTLNFDVASIIDTNTWAVQIIEGIPEPGPGPGPSMAPPPGDGNLGTVLLAASGNLPGDGIFVPMSVSTFNAEGPVIPATGGLPLQIRLINFGGIQTLFDNVSVIETLPPPPGDVLGDYNGNGTVDAADYTVWRDNLGSDFVMPNDSTPGMITQEDYDVWTANFGMVGSSSGLSAAVVPEPASLSLCLALLLLGLVLRNSFHCLERRRGIGV